MQIIQGIAYLVDPCQHLRFSQRTAKPLKHYLQVFALNIVHHQVLSLVWDDEVIDDARQVGVFQLVKDFGLALELPLCIF